MARSIGLENNAGEGHTPVYVEPTRAANQNKIDFAARAAAVREHFENHQHALNATDRMIQAGPQSRGEATPIISPLQTPVNPVGPKGPSGRIFS